MSTKDELRNEVVLASPLPHNSPALDNSRPRLETPTLTLDQHHPIQCNSRLKDNTMNRRRARCIVCHDCIVIPVESMADETFLNTYQAPKVQIPRGVHASTSLSEYDFNYCFEIKTLRSDRVELRPFLVRLEWRSCACIISG